MTNINQQTGIRYSCIYLNSLDGDLANDLWMNAENLSESAAYAELVETVKAEANILVDDGDLDIDDMSDWIDREVDRRGDSIQIEEPTLAGICEGVRYEISWLGGAPLLWVLESPIISKARLCSPCCPNAGDLNSLDDDGYECYGIPADWYAKD